MGCQTECPLRIAFRNERIARYLANKYLRAVALSALRLGLDYLPVAGQQAARRPRSQLSMRATWFSSGRPG